MAYRISSKNVDFEHCALWAMSLWLPLGWTHPDRLHFNSLKSELVSRWVEQYLKYICVALLKPVAFPHALHFSFLVGADTALTVTSSVSVLRHCCLCS